LTSINYQTSFLYQTSCSTRKI